MKNTVKRTYEDLDLEPEEDDLYKILKDEHPSKKILSEEKQFLRNKNL